MDDTTKSVVKALLVVFVGIPALIAGATFVLVGTGTNVAPLS